MNNCLEKIRKLNRQAWELWDKDGPKAILLARQAESLLAACPEATPSDEFDCLKTQAYCLDILSKPEEALPVGLRAQTLAKQIGDPYFISSIQNILGRIYWHIDDFPTAMDYYLNALKQVQPGSHPVLEISLVNGLGMVQYGLGNYPEALGYFKSCLEKSSADNLSGRADANNNIAYVLHLLGRDQEALEYGLVALDLFKQTGSNVGKLHTLHSVGAIYFSLGNYDQAMAFLQEGLASARQNNSQILELAYIIEINKILKVHGRLDQAEAELLEALQIAEKINSLTNISQIHEQLVEIYKERCDYKSALEHFEIFHTTHKKIFNDRSDHRLKNLEILHRVELARKQADLYRELAGTDALTGLINRRRFLEIAEIAYEQAKISASPLALIMLDIDHFKQINDQYGHRTGDEVLTAIAASIKKSLRQEEIAARYGGEEFIVLVAGVSQEQCTSIGERIRKAVAQQTIQIGQTVLNMTISLGLACADPDDLMPLNALINAADQAMYAAKQQGRNRLVVLTRDLQC